MTNNLLNSRVATKYRPTWMNNEKQVREDALNQYVGELEDVLEAFDEAASRALKVLRYNDAGYQGLSDARAKLQKVFELDVIEREEQAVAAWEANRKEQDRLENDDRLRSMGVEPRELDAFPAFLKRRSA